LSAVGWRCHPIGPQRSGGAGAAGLTATGARRATLEMPRRALLPDFDVFRDDAAGWADQERGEADTRDTDVSKVSGADSTWNVAVCEQPVLPLRVRDVWIPCSQVPAYLTAHQQLSSEISLTDVYRSIARGFHRYPYQVKACGPF